jgi:hypothetical protein
MSLEDLANAEPPAGPRILFIDLERVPGDVTLDVWDPKDFRRINYVHPSRWNSRPEMLSFAARWETQRRGEFHASWDSDDPHHLAHESWRMVDEATHIVTYYGRKADEPWLKQAWLKAKLPPPSTYKHIDLYYVARQFGLPSGSLDELCSFLGLPGKRGHYSIEAARACLAGDERKRAEMRRYNLGDVGPNSLGGVFEILRPWIPGLNLGAYYLDAVEVARCPGCGKVDTLADLEASIDLNPEGEGDDEA